MKDWKTMFMLKIMISAGIKREENSNGRHISSRNEQIFFGMKPYIVCQIAQKIDKQARGSR